MKMFFKKLSTFQMIILGFIAVILAGSLILMLPFSTAENVSAPFMDTLFTSVSAVCVTGLIVHDTATYWSGFGQAVILILIQIGGLGVVSAATSIALFSGKKINLKQRSTMQEALSAPQVGGIVKLTGFIIRITFFIEFVGCVIMAPVFCKDFGFFKGLWYSVFHSVSAFCNAGFDLMGVKEQYSSLTSYSGHPLINIVIMLLIIIGGIGFMTLDDIKCNKFHIKKYRMQTKVILVTSGLLILIPAVCFFFFEFSSDRWNISLSQRIFYSLFQAVTPRTAGFNTVNFNMMKQGSIVIMLILMLTGGSPGSTAGGMKTTTLAVLISSAISVFKRREDTRFFGRRIPDDAIKKSTAILMMYLSLFLIGGIIISNIENLPILDCLFETASAIGTVGLSKGLTPELGNASHIILMILMFVGRVGGLTFIFAAFFSKSNSMAKLPLEKINVG